MKFLADRRAFYVLGMALLGLLMVVLSAPWSRSGSNDVPTLDGLPTTPEPDADSPADTIKTLTASMSSLVQEIDSLAQANLALRAENEELQAKTDLIEVRITERLRTELALQQDVQAELAANLNDLMARLDTPSQTVEQSYSISAYGDQAGYAGSGDWHWVEAMETSHGDGLAIGAEQAELPIYTIPQNATLVNSTTMTALIGRVPVENRVTDPLPFKVVTGADNLAANGYTIEGLTGSIWSGFAVGDWALSCVSGSLTSVTFVFEDGRIRTLGTNQPNGERIGWISDARGIPCITGDRKTNVRSWLIAQLGVNATKSVAGSLATANTTVQRSPSGFKEAFVSGDIREYVLGASMADTGDALTQWLTSRASQEFDAIFVATDKSVAIHVDIPLHIDYEPQGRKLNYDQNELPYEDVSTR